MSRWILDTEMNIEGLACTLNMPPALQSMKVGDQELVQTLPPYDPRPVYLVDEYPGCPEEWERSRPGVISYFVGVEEGKGLWLDFNECVKHLHDVAILPSVQGLNPITGLPQDGVKLEQYRSRCPVHDVEFQDKRFCPECKYRWPAQNYMATTGTPDGHLWIDGFRSKDGVVRQYIFTANEMRGVATVKMGDKRVHSIGIAFYTSKEKKPQQIQRAVTRGLVPAAAAGAPWLGTQYSKGSSLGMIKKSLSHNYGSDNVKGWDPGTSYTYTSSGKYSSADSTVSEVDISVNNSAGTPGEYFHESDMQCFVNYSADTIPVVEPREGSEEIVELLRSVVEEKSRGGIILPERQDNRDPEDGFVYHTLKGKIRKTPAEPVQIKRLEVAAGAKIDQEVFADPKPLDYWNEELAGVIYINYAHQPLVDQILAGGKRVEEADGFLAGVQVGN